MNYFCLALITAFGTLTSTICDAGDRCHNGAPTQTHRPVVYVSPNPTIRYEAKPTAARRAETRPASPPVMGTSDRLKAAKAAFRIGHNNNALAHASILIQQMPKNSNLLQFRSMVYFRKGDYRRAAMDAYEAVKHGPLWNVSVVFQQDA